MAGRMAIFKQQMKERLGGGTATKKSEIPEVTAEMEITESMRDIVKKQIKYVGKDEKAIKHFADTGTELCDSLTKISTELGEIQVDMLASAMFDVVTYQRVANEAHTTLFNAIENDIKTPFTQLTDNELKEAKMQENKFEKTRVALDAAISEVAQLKGNKKTKPETLAAAEAKQEQAQQQFDATGQETQETLHEINLLTECTLIEKWCDYMEAYQQHFLTLSRYLNDIIPSVYNYKRFIQESREIRESIMLPSPAGAPSSVLVFGVPIQTLVARQGSTVPILVQAAVDWISEKGLEEAGLFRVSPGVAELAQFKVWANTNDNPDLSTVCDPHLVASLLKTFFRELPEPILTYKLYQPLIDTNSCKDKNERLKTIAALMTELPDANYQSMRLLMWLLSCVIIYSDKNMMNAGNLATCWAPNLMAPESINPSTFDPFEPRAVVEFMIENYTHIFPEEGEEAPEDAVQ